MDKITPIIWIGDHEAVKEPFDIVISVLTSDEIRKYKIESKLPSGVQWHHIPLDDDDSDRIHEFFAITHTILTKAEETGHSVLVHCAAGISRSPSMVIAHLMKKFQWSYADTLAIVQKQRAICRPNDAFEKALRSLENPKTH